LYQADELDPFPHETGRQHEDNISMVSGYYHGEELHRFRKKEYFCQQFGAGGGIWKIYGEWEQEERNGMGACEKEQRAYEDRIKRARERREKLKEMKKRREERAQRKKEKLEAKEKRAEEREEQRMLGIDVDSSDDEEEDDPLDAEYDDLEFDVKDANIDLGDDPDALSGVEMLEIQREELMEEWGEHMDKIVMIQKLYRGHLGWSKMMALRADIQAKYLRDFPPFGADVTVENIKIGTRVQRGSDWPEYWDADGGPQLDEWGGVGTVLGYKDAIGNVIGRDPGHPLYAAIRWDCQVPGSSHWFRYSIGAQNELVKLNQPVHHLSHCTGIGKMKVEKVEDHNVYVGARVMRGPRWVVGSNDAEEETEEGEATIQRLTIEVAEADRYYALRFAAEQQAPGHLLTLFKKRTMKANKKLQELRNSLRMARVKLHRDRQLWDYDGPMSGYGASRTKSHTAGTVVGYRLSAPRPSQAGSAGLGTVFGVDPERDHPRDRGSWAQVRWDQTGITQDYSIGEKGCWGVDGRAQDYRKQAEEPGKDGGEYMAVHNLYFQEHGGRRQAFVIQPIMRGHLGRNVAKFRLKSVVDIQRCYRGMEARREYKRMRGISTSSDDDSDDED